MRCGHLSFHMGPPIACATPQKPPKKGCFQLILTKTELWTSVDMWGYQIYAWICWTDRGRDVATLVFTWGLRLRATSQEPLQKKKKLFLRYKTEL